MSDELTELPEGWIWTDIKSIASVVTGKTPSTSNADFWDGEIPFVTPSQIHPLGNILPPNRTLTELGAAQARIIPENSTLTVCIGTVGKIGLLDRPSVINQQLNALVPSKNVSAQFLYYWSQYFLRSWIIENASATVNAAILNKSRLETAPVVLAPLNEQKRIVAKIEELNDRLHRSKQALEAVPELCDRFRQSVLAAAFRGDLTADWREENPDVEPASVLLERIRSDRPQSPIKSKVSLEAIDLSTLPEIPETWMWEKLINVSNLLGGVTKGRKFNGQPTIQVPYLRVANVQDGFLDLEEVKEIEVLPGDISKYRLENGDILFTEGGDRDKLGRGTVWRNEIEGCIHQNHVYRARLYSSEVLPEYISLAAKTEYAKNYFFRNASQTVNLASINITTLGNLPLPIPTLKEQKEICDRVYKLFQSSDLIRNNHQTLFSQLERLNQSILAKAFQGELVEQDPNDEPASVLLDRIRVEREKLQDNKKSGSARGKRKKATDNQLDLPGVN